MSYYAITFKSKKLRKNKIYINEYDDMEDSEDEYQESEMKMSRKEKRAQKKQLKEERNRKQNTENLAENVYIINGEEVAEEDLTKDERADIEANNLLNQDHFYDPIDPIDWGVKTKVKRKIQPIYIVCLFICLGLFVAIFAFAYSTVSSF